MVATGSTLRKWQIVRAAWPVVFLRVAGAEISTSSLEYQGLPYLGVASTSEVRKQLCLLLISLVAAGIRSLVLLDVHWVSSSSRPENLQPPTPSKSRSMPALVMISRVVVSNVLEVIAPCMDQALLRLLVPFFLRCWDIAGEGMEPFTGGRE